MWAVQQDSVTGRGAFRGSRTPQSSTGLLEGEQTHPQVTSSRACDPSTPGISAKPEVREEGPWHTDGETAPFPGESHKPDHTHPQAVYQDIRQTRAVLQDAVRQGVPATCQLCASSMPLGPAPHHIRLQPTAAPPHSGMS